MFYDSRAELQFKATPFDYFDIIFKLRAGDYIWGHQQETGMFSGKGEIKTAHLYGSYAGVNNFIFRAGLMDWSDPMGLVLDDDLAGFFVTYKPTPEIAIEFGHAILRSAQTREELGYEDYFASYNIAYGSDDALLFFSFDYDNMVGLKTITNTFKPSGDMHQGISRVINIWAMPYATLSFNDVNLTAMFAINYGQYTDDNKPVSERDYNNMGFAAAIDFEIDLDLGGIPGFNLLFTTGQRDITEPETSYFDSISPLYKNGLEFLGNGIHEGSPNRYFSILDPRNYGKGLLSAVVRYEVPFLDNLSGLFAAGYVQALESLTHLERNHIADVAFERDEVVLDKMRVPVADFGKEMGTEINLGLRFRFLHDSYFAVKGAFMKPGDFFKRDVSSLTKRGEDQFIYGVHSAVEIKF